MTSRTAPPLNATSAALKEPGEPNAREPSGLKAMTSRSSLRVPWRPSMNRCTIFASRFDTVMPLPSSDTATL